MTKTSIQIVGIFIYICSINVACTRTSLSISNKEFVEVNQYKNFHNWKGWSIAYNSGKYNISIINDSTKSPHFILFKKGDIYYTRLMLPDTVSPLISLDSLRKNNLWKSKYSMVNYELFKSHAIFMETFNLEYAFYEEEPSRITFKPFGKNAIIYIFDENDTIKFKEYYIRLSTHWYEYRQG